MSPSRLDAPVDTEAARTALIAALSDPGTGSLGNFVMVGEAIEGASVSQFDVTAELAEQVSADVVKAVEALTRRQFIAYDPSYQTNASQVLVEDLASIPALAGVDAAIRGGDLPIYPGGGTVVAMTHAVGLGPQQVVAYRVKGAGIFTRRAKWILLPRDGVYAPIDSEVLYYEPRFDVFTCAGYAYFVTVSLIQTKLQADDKARQLAKTTLATVTAKIRIDGFAELEKAVMDDPTMRAKLAAVARLLESDPDYASHLTTKRLIQFVTDNPDYKIPMGQVEGKPALRFDPSPQHRHQIPKLLADDYLHSQLTKRNYEAGSKQRVQA